jgi:hypothetical protein
MELRRVLLREHPEVQERLRTLARARRSGPFYSWQPELGVKYYAEAERLVRDLDAVWSLAEIDALVADAALLEDRIAGRRGIGLGLSAGRTGRGRRTTTAILELVANSIAQRAAGSTATEADRLAAARADPSFPRDAETITLYRKRLRDRLS